MGSPRQPEREETDTSLRAERDRTDDELARLTEERDDDADLAIERARASAGETDPVTADQQAADDAELAAGRAAQEQALEQLLALEREETDDHLDAERARADHVVAARDDFLAIVSHDARGILGGIAFSATLLSQISADGEAGQRIQTETQRIRRLTARMNRIVGDLLDVVAMESGTLTVAPTPQDPAAVITEVLDGFRGLAAARRIELTARVPDRTNQASFDHDRVVQVLSNLVANALKFTSAGGKVVLELTEGDDEIQFTVRDTGCGIPPDRVEEMFERFAQAATGDRRGLGLGLYIARSIVRAHGGRVWAESEPGVGSAFHVTLPRRSDPG